MTGYEGPGSKPNKGPRTKEFTAQQLATYGERLTLPHRKLLAVLINDKVGYKEAAAQLQWPLGTVKSRGNRARAALQKLIELDAATQERAA